jgi:glycosyltransferase involved in cell wall biosynthesis
MKILQVIPTVDPASGGPAEAVRQLCSIYRAGGHDVEVASLDTPESTGQFDFPARVHGLGPGWGVYGYTGRAGRWFKDNIARYDVALLNGVWQYDTLAAYRALRRSKTPYAVFPHGMLDPYFERQFPLKHAKKLLYWHLFLRRILRDATAVLFTCEEEKILARKSFPGYIVREMVAPLGILGPERDLSDAAEELLTRWPVLRGKRVASTMGRIHPKKGTDVLIEAFARTLAKDPAWHLLIAGPDQTGWQKELEALAARLGVAEKITWTGMLTGSPKWGVFAASEVFVLPSHQENFGIVVAEASASSVPVILSSKVNIWREVESHGAGLICDDTAESTAVSMERWAAMSRDEIAEMRVRSKQCFDELFNYEVTARKALEIVEQVARREVPR